MERGQNTTRGGSDPIAPQNRGPIPPGFGGHSRFFLLGSAARILAADYRGNFQGLCKTSCQTNSERGLRTKHANHQSTTQTAEVGHHPSAG